MAADTARLDALAALLTYPRDGYREQVAACRDGLRSGHPKAAASCDSFDRETEGLTHGELQELFTRTFDHNPTTCLEVGWHIFGENYSRGAFLVEMRGMLRRFQLAESTELPDHLTHALPVLGRLNESEAAEFSRTRVQPAVERVYQGLDGKNNSYAHLLAAIRTVLADRYGPASTAGLPLPVLKEHDDLVRMEDC